MFLLQVLELLLSQERVITLLFEKTFPDQVSSSLPLIVFPHLIISLLLACPDPFVMPSSMSDLPPPPPPSCYQTGGNWMISSRVGINEAVRRAKAQERSATFLSVLLPLR